MAILARPCVGVKNFSSFFGIHCQKSTRFTILPNCLLVKEKFFSKGGLYSTTTFSFHNTSSFPCVNLRIILFMFLYVIAYAQFSVRVTYLLCWAETRGNRKYCTTTAHNVYLHRKLGFAPRKWKNKRLR